jgi:hypothetical protein
MERPGRLRWALPVAAIVAFALVVVMATKMIGCVSEPEEVTEGEQGIPEFPTELPTEGLAAPPIATVVVGDPAALNASEQAMIGHMRRTYRIRIRDDSDSHRIPPRSNVVVMSKTVLSTTVGTNLKPLTCGVVFWEDNQQMLSMMATIDNDGSQGTAWHSEGSSVYVLPDALPELAAGLSGTLEFYVQPAQITWSPIGETSPDGEVIAWFSLANGRAPIYAYERGALLADGTDAAGRRVYFGLYDDTFTLLTADGLALFDAALRWAAVPNPPEVRKWTRPE